MFFLGMASKILDGNDLFNNLLQFKYNSGFEMYSIFSKFIFFVYFSFLVKIRS